MYGCHLSFDWRMLLKLTVVGRWHGSRAGTHRYGEFGREEEPAPLADCALNPDLSTHQLHQLPRNRQSQPSAAVFSGCRGIRLGEVLEDASELLGRNSDPGILHAEKQGSRLCALRILLYFNIHSPGLGELHRVPEQVQEDLAQPQRVANQHARKSFREV